MNSFAALSLPTRLELALWIEFSILFYVLLVCFLRVGSYVKIRFQAGKLVAGVNAPMPIRIPALSGWLFVVGVLLILFLQSPLFYVMAPAGIVICVLGSGRDLGDQFGFGRLFFLRLVKWILVIYGAILFIEIPLNALVEEAFNAVNLPQPEQENVRIFRSLNDPGKILIFIASAVVLSPLVEELFFRGFLQTFLKNFTSPWLAIVLSSGVFAFAHVDLGSVVQLWVLGIALGLAYEHTGALPLPIGIHSCFNLASALTLLFEKAISN